MAYKALPTIAEYHTHTHTHCRHDHNLGDWQPVCTSDQLPSTLQLCNHHLQSSLTLPQKVNKPERMLANFCSLPRGLPLISGSG